MGAKWLAAGVAGLWLVAGNAMAFGFDDVAALAQRTAAGPWQAPAQPLPADLAGLNYDGLRDIRYRPDRAVWGATALPFQLQFFHLGGRQATPVQVHQIVAGQVQHLAYDPAAWTFGANRLAQAAWGDLGHAGFRVHHALNTPQYLDELLVFLGASYFRALGRGQQYGLSARGLAVDTVGGSGPEEFPRFSQFWVEQPAPGATTLTVHALLESPRLTGAYRFTVQPGDSTTLQVQARLFLRSGVAAWPQIGLAPLTSMFLHGENQPRVGDFRPEVHDSDGLLVAAVSDGNPDAPAVGTAAEWLWRPLVNPRQPLASSFGVRRLDGFGLLQRDRRFASYEDSEAHYERRPSAWVTPLGDWGPGRVQLLQLPTPDETEDNIVAYWAPARLPPPGQPLDLAYRLQWQGDAPQQPPHGWTVQSRRGHGWAAATPGELQFMVDFDGPALRALPAGASVAAVASAASNARITSAHAYPHPGGGWRMQLRAQRLDARLPMELRAFLQHGPHALTETWTALVPQD